MKNIFFVTFLLVSFTSFAAKKKTAYVAYVSGTFSMNESSIRKVGNVYELIINTLTENVLLDSVWFGATPVPCDLLETKTRHKIEKASEKGTYIVRANRNLYENFPGQTDSTQAYKNFKPPFRFKGDAVIMYKVKGKRYYTIAYQVKQVRPKGTRE
jgi:hypothetical protein